MMIHTALPSHVEIALAELFVESREPDGKERMNLYQRDYTSAFVYSRGCQVVHR